MKKILSILAVSALMFISACAETTDENKSGNDTVSTKVESNAADAVNDGGENPENSENNEESTEDIVYGEVYEVIGNMLVLKIINMPEGFSNITSDGSRQIMRGFNMEDMTEEERQAFEERIQENGGNFAGGATFNMDDMTEEERQAMQERFQNAEGNEPVFFQGGDFSGGENIVTGEGRQKIERKLEYTGEERDVIIPVGTPILTFDFSNGEMSETEVDITSVKSGSVVTINYNGDGSIEKVFLMG